MTVIAYSSLESRIGCSVCSGKGAKAAVEYSTVQPLLHLRANRTKNMHISEYEYSQQLKWLFKMAGNTLPFLSASAIKRRQRTVSTSHRLFSHAASPYGSRQEAATASRLKSSWNS